MRISDWSSDVCSSDLSPTRDEAGFALAKWDYKHRAFVTALFHEKPHDNTAWEIFYPAGPFALLPLLDDAPGRHRSALVWTVAEKDDNGIAAKQDAMSAMKSAVWGQRVTSGVDMGGGCVCK